MRLYSVVGKKHGTAFLFCLRVFVLLLLIWTLFQIADSGRDPFNQNFRFVHSVISEF